MITLRELLNLIKKGQAPHKIIYDYTVFEYKEGRYLDRFGKPWTLDQSVGKDLATVKCIEVIG